MSQRAKYCEELYEAIIYEGTVRRDDMFRNIDRRQSVWWRETFVATYGEAPSSICGASPVFVWKNRATGEDIMSVVTCVMLKVGSYDENALISYETI